MQNAYASPGGYLDLAGFDIAGARAGNRTASRACWRRRARPGMPVIYFQNGWDPDYVEAGGPGSPNWHKSNALKTMRERPELEGKLLAKGAWDYALVDELTPQKGDIVIAKPRYSRLLQHRRSTACCARAASGTWSSPASPPTSAWRSTLRDGFSWNISAWCWRTPRTRPARPSCRRPPSTTSRSSSAGSPASPNFAARAAGQRQPHPQDEG